MIVETGREPHVKVMRRSATAGGRDASIHANVQCEMPEGGNAMEIPIDISTLDVTAVGARPPNAAMFDRWGHAIPIRT